MSIPILLVHGSFHNGDCWDKFLPHLVERGFEPHVLSLAGHRGSTRPAAEASMEAYAQDVIARALLIGRPCLLLGHSMGGLVISGAAEQRPDLFTALIYLTAFAPAPGRHSCLQIAPISAQMLKVVMSDLIPLGEGCNAFPEEGAKSVFYNRCTPEDQAWAVSRLSRQPQAAGRDAMTTSAQRLGQVPKHYIECTYDAAIPLESQRAMQSHMAFRSVHTIDSDHSPFVSAASALAEVVAKIASAAR